MESCALYLFLRGVNYLDFEMTVKIQKNKDDNVLMQYMISILNKIGRSRRKGLQRENYGIKRDVFLKRMTDI